MHDATFHRSIDVLQPPMAGAPTPGPVGPSQTSHDPSHGRRRENGPREWDARHGRVTYATRDLRPKLGSTRDSTQVLPSYAGTNNKSKVQNNEECSPTSSKELKTEFAQRIKQLTNTQKLHASTPALIQGLKWVANERAKLGESSTTKIIKNRGWNRRESVEEMFELLGSGSRPPARQRKNRNYMSGRRSIRYNTKIMTFIGCSKHYLAGNLSGPMLITNN
ncbi:myb-like protein V [Dorcoceras hygrometricum]|uniref:Myb-like protein V n=1 Tax=Dorcoceras hygrometricum TaxID=472368 RepID=A0A2Z7BGI6_9LAMI|nr:myb-like protein V [Dorcoceras hygrometricum]